VDARQRKENHRATSLEDTSMRNEIGVWIDHRRAVIATMDGDKVHLQEVLCDVSSSARSLAEPDGDGPVRRSAGDRYADQLNEFYDRVIAHLKTAGSILIIGPGEAKLELEAHLDQAAMGGRIIGVETVNHLSDAEISQKVKERYTKGLDRPGVEAR
jgi:stalled ribosome rescue protein Dom34